MQRLRQRFYRVFRRLRFGPPIIVVSGLPRSGTSMMMQMLAAGGLDLVTDGTRVADESNPRGYFELEAVKDLDKGLPADWLAGARGRGVKILSPQLPWLPESYNYRVIFMQRQLDEVVASQNAMLTRLGADDNSDHSNDPAAQLTEHLRKTQALLARRPCFETLTVSHAGVLTDTRGQAARIAAFVDSGLDTARMAAVVDQRLWRQRAETSGLGRAAQH